MTRAGTLGVLLMLGVMLGGCGSLFGEDGWFRDRSDEYRQARALPPPTVPAGLDSERIQSFLVIPGEGSPRLSADFEVPRPEPLPDSATEQSVRIQRLGRDRWVLVSLTPDQVWPLLKTYLASNRISLARENPEQGLMATGWLRAEGEPLPEQYLYRLEPGVQRGTTEIHVRQRVQGPDASDPPWPRHSDKPAREQQMVRLVAGHLATAAAELPSVSLMAQGIRQASKVRLRQREDGSPYLQVDLSTPRAWASLGAAIRKSRFEMTDKNREAGVYYVRPAASEDDKPGFWARWLGGDRQTDAGPTLQYRVVPVTDERVEIVVQDREGRPLTPSEATRYLNRIKGLLT